jgi:hypothetical protein
MVGAVKKKLVAKSMRQMCEWSVTLSDEPLAGYSYVSVYATIGTPFSGFNHFLEEIFWDNFWKRIQKIIQN